jgi:diaminohydroxyphosphoribosylaminopyrimidine deaminase / 5-amino-6-(5-phosphoribosylamino)uracil reductase
MTTDEKYMLQCIRIAKKGLGFVSPNPLVGCVIVKNGKIIGKGYHKKYGESHAERNAIADAKKNGFDVKGSTVYVNLEPCSHFGNQPPCADALIEEKVKKVVIGIKDPYVEVNGKGIKKLKAAGIDVFTRVLEKECRELNKVFLKNVIEKLPYVTLKIAQSLDGNIALNNYKSKWITCEVSRNFVQKLRSINDAILIGGNTAENDDPSLTVREMKGKNPKRIIIAGDKKLPGNLKIFTDGNEKDTIIITTENMKVKNFPRENIIKLNGRDGIIPLKNILKKVFDTGVRCILVEGGANVFSQFLKYNLFDEMYLFIAPKIIGSGISSFGNFNIQSLNKAYILDNLKYRKSGNDLLAHYKKCSQE